MLCKIVWIHYNGVWTDGGWMSWREICERRVVVSVAGMEGRLYMYM